jgi:hypothetical protein
MTESRAISECVTFDRVDSLLRYDSDTGKLYWRVKPSRRVRSGSEAGCLRSDGYIVIKIDGKLYYAQRVAWILHEGQWPDGNPEHENRIGSDNRWENIKDLAPDESHNGGNKGTLRNNTSNLKGVYWYKRDNKWKAHIGVHMRRVHIGLFPEDQKREAGLHYDAVAKLVWGYRFSHLNFPSEESDHIILSDRILLQCQ